MCWVWIWPVPEFDLGHIDVHKHHAPYVSCGVSHIYVYKRIDELCYFRRAIWEHCVCDLDQPSDGQDILGFCGVRVVFISVRFTEAVVSCHGSRNPHMRLSWRPLVTRGAFGVRIVNRSNSTHNWLVLAAQLRCESPRGFRYPLCWFCDHDAPWSAQSVAARSSNCHWMPYSKKFCAELVGLLKKN